ncbi:MAG: hypothetical protein R3E95_21090 [Thiolinea sp.]
MVDTTGDGVPDKTLSQLTDTDLIYGTGPDGSQVTVVVSGTADGNPDVTLPPGVNITLVPTVFAPSDAAPGSTDVLTVYATNTDTADTNAPSATVEDVSKVILGQVRLSKTVAYDGNCNNTADGYDAVNNTFVEGTGAFEPTLSIQIPPDQCAIWQIVAENQGDAEARNVIITDNVPAFTTFESGSFMYQPTAAAPMDPALPANAVHNTTTDEVTFFIGTGAADPNGGTLQPGQISTVRFTTRID